VIRAAVAAALIWAAPAAAQDANPTIGGSVAEMVFGVYCAEPPADRVEAPGTVSGVINIVRDLPVMQAGQLLVPAELGVGFGVLVDMQPGRSFGQAIVELTHPPYPTNGVEVETYITDLSDAVTNLVGFSFDHDYELVPGPWTFRVFEGEEEIFEITFEVAPPGTLPPSMSPCAGAFTS
jgi:hypothetical protein